MAQRLSRLLGEPHFGSLEGSSDPQAGAPGLNLPLVSERMARLLYPQTLWILLGLAIGMVAVSVLVRVRATYAFDLRVTRGCQDTDHPFLTGLARWSTFMGNSLTLVILTVG